jgi:hypothetical protein
VTAQFLHMTPLADVADLIEIIQPLHRLRKDYGFTITHSMSGDVNGHNWGLADVLLDAGVTSMSMAINEHFGGAPFHRPNLFRWTAPSGRTIAAFNGWHYNIGNWVGIGKDADEIQKMRPIVQKKLDEAAWPFNFIAMQMVGYGGDNQTADVNLSKLVETWNARGEGLTIKFATWREFWKAVGEKIGQQPAVAGDWTDYWNFGALSSAKETTIGRTSRSRLHAADTLLAIDGALGASGNPDGSGTGDLPGRDPGLLLATAAEIRRRGWKNLETWQEHTWGWYGFVAEPEDEYAYAQWSHKAGLAYTARSCSLMLARDGVAELGVRVPAAEDDALLVFNPLPWKRTVSGDLLGGYTATRIAQDPTSSRQGQDAHGVVARLKPTEVPALGYVMVKKDAVEKIEQDATHREDATVETDHLKVTFDRETGGIVSWQDKALKRELVDGKAGWKFGAVAYEAVADREARWPRMKMFGPVFWDLDRHKPNWHPGFRAVRHGAKKLLTHKVYDTAAGIEVVQTVEVEGLASPAVCRFLMPTHAPHVELRAQWTMGLSNHPEATYLTMPFEVPGARARFDIGGQGIEPGKEQLPGTCRDYFTVQNWVDLSNEEFGVTIATPENPLVQLGDFNFGANRKTFHLHRAMFLGWVTNTYWDTNFRGNQPGRVWARYVMTPHKGGYDESAAHRLGMEAAHVPLFHPANELRRPNADLPREGTLLELPAPPVVVLHVLGDGPEHVIVRLLNASDKAQTARIGSGILTIERAEQCDLFGQVRQDIAVSRGAASVSLESRRLAVVRLKVKPR